MKIWDREGGDDGKGGEVEMTSLNAKEALKNDPKRYCAEKPEPPAPKQETKADKSGKKAGDDK